MTGTVKALVWNPFRAETPFGYYQIDDQTDRSAEELKGRPPFLLSGSRLDLSRHPTLADARAAAQADYERRVLSALTASASEPAPSFQARVQPWMMACFGEEISNDRVERGDRLLEEVFELLQSGGYDPARVLSLRDYVWSREVGEPSQEAGGVQVTMAAYCLAHGLDMHEAGETELARIWTKVETIRAKQAAKPKHSPLPVPASEPEPVAWQSYSDISGWTVVDPDYAKHLIENGIPVRPLFVRSALPNFSSKSEEGNQ